MEKTREYLPVAAQMGERTLSWLFALLFAMLFPSLVTFTQMILLAGAANGAQQIVYVGGTLIQFSFPVLSFSVIRRRFPLPKTPTPHGLAIGLAFGLIVGAGTIALHHIFLKSTPMMQRTAAELHLRLTEFGIASPVAFALFAVFLTIVHSLLEEYYWRWFVFGTARRFISHWPAIIVSAIAFTLHHVILLWVWFPDHILLAVVPFSLCTAIGGGFWAWLYDRSGSIWAAWLSHLLVDAAVFVVGYDLFFSAQ